MGKTAKKRAFSDVLLMFKSIILQNCQLIIFYQVSIDKILNKADSWVFCFFFIVPGGRILISQSENPEWAVWEVFHNK